MLKLNAIHQNKIWGYERWIASTHRDGCQSEFLSFYGKDYPLIVKVIQANEALSVQVHPDDALAKQLEGENERGKTECWYILDAQKDAKLIYGIKKGVSKEQIESAIKAGNLEEKMNYVSVKKGDFVFIPAGTVHAIGGGLRLMEVQQSSNTTYRLYDYNRGREIHVEKGLQAVKTNTLLPIEQFKGEFDCPYFSLKKHDVKSSATFEKSVEVRLFYAISAESGAKITCGEESESVSAEDIFAVSSGESIEFNGNLSLMEIVAK